jgi:DeoR family transcriptional regulator, deoxyribose operon repressor
MTEHFKQRTGTIPRRPHRLKELARAIGERGPLHLRDAAQMLGVSEMTVRRDVAASGNLFGYLGGHLIAGGGADVKMSRYILDEEAQHNAPAKIAACTRAAELIADGDTIFIDCGSTMPHLAARIARGVRATAVCYSLNVANILCANPDLRVVLLGGLWHPSSASFSSEENLALIAKLGINKAFISAAGVDAQRGVSCVQFHEVAIKQAAIARSVQKYLVVDASKFGQVKPAFFAPLTAFDAIVTDQEDPQGLFSQAASGTRLLVAGAY